MIAKNGNELFIAIKRYQHTPVDTIGVIEAQNTDNSAFADSLLKDPTVEFYRFELGERVVIKKETIVSVEPKV
jgi:hypothetical protein